MESFRIDQVHENASSSVVECIEVYELNIPFDDFSSGFDAPAGRWSSFDTILIRVTTADGISGWGECFAYGCRTTVAECLRTMVIPLVLGKDALDIPHLMNDVQRTLHLFGRYGITMFAISGIDIALWDRKARANNMSLAELIGTKHRTSVPAYASLVHYGNAELVRHRVSAAVSEGYRTVKLHETNLGIIEAGRAGVGDGTGLAVDANCAWTLEQALKILPQLKALKVGWLEEPLFPPEDFSSLSRLSAASEVPLSAGENACTRYDFRKMMETKSVDLPQPSVTKMGGVTEFLAVIQESESIGVRSMPHSPYFGPGYWATLQLLSTVKHEVMLERLFVEPSAFPGINTPLPNNGYTEIPSGFGTGFEPDWQTIEEYAI